MLDLVRNKLHPRKHIYNRVVKIWSNPLHDIIILSLVEALRNVAREFLVQNIKTTNKISKEATRRERLAIFASFFNLYLSGLFMRFCAVSVSYVFLCVYIGKSSS